MASQELKNPKKVEKSLKLMHSKAMLEKPEDLEEKWLLVPFPQGKRVVVSTKECETHISTNKCVRLMSFQSHLPGGNKRDKDSAAEETALDCVFDKDAGIIYVFDMITWKGHSVSDSAAQFRLMWLKTKIDEIPTISQKSLYNPYIIKTLPVLPCTNENIQQCLESETQYHGLLFYNKQGMYTPGQSSHLLWLKPYMAQEVFGITVPGAYMEKKPKSYTDFPSYIQKMKDGEEKRDKQREEAQARKQSRQEKAKFDLDKKKKDKPVQEKAKCDLDKKKNGKPVRAIRRAHETGAIEKKIPPIGRGGMHGSTDKGTYPRPRIQTGSGYDTKGSYSDTCIQSKYGGGGYQGIPSRMAGLSLSENPSSQYSCTYNHNYDMPNEEYNGRNYSPDYPFNRPDSFNNQNGLSGNYNQGYGSAPGSYSARNQGYCQENYSMGGQSYQRDLGSYSQANQGLSQQNYPMGIQGYQPSSGSHLQGKQSLLQQNYPMGNQEYQQNQFQGNQFGENFGNRRKQTVAERLWSAKKGQQNKNKKEQPSSKSQKVSEKQKSKKESHCSSQQQRTQLMCSQWLTQVPDDLEDEWLMVPSPMGQHVRVVAKDGITTAYSKKGNEMEQFKSQLPGGNEHFKHCDQNHTVLDCIYSASNSTYYIMDIMCWKGQPLCGCETGFRFHWLHVKIKEQPILKEVGKLNKYAFVAVSSESCNKISMQKLIDRDLGDLKINGMLFYRKTCKYVAGSVPDVLFLKLYMLPEVLNIHVPEEYMTFKPDSYVNFMTHLQKIKERNDDAKLEGGVDIVHGDDVKIEDPNVVVDLTANT